MKYFLTLSAAVALVLTAQTAFAQTPAPALTKTDVEKIVQDYIAAHPEVIIDSLNGYQQQQQNAAQEGAAKALETYGKNLVTADTPQAGNPKGDVTIVEFFDYNCGYCKKMLPTVTELLKDDKKLRVAFKEFPILHASSESAARMALAVNRMAPQKYIAFHAAVMGHNGAITDEFLAEEVKKLGLDPVKVKAEGNSPAVSKIIDTDKELASKLSIQGTPAFIVGKTVIPGATDLPTLKAKIAEARAGKK